MYVARPAELGLQPQPLGAAGVNLVSDVQAALCQLTRAYERAQQVLAAAGVPSLNDLLSGLSSPAREAVCPTPTAGRLAGGRKATLPYYDADDRILWFDDRIVKRYRVPSPNQETILAAFQEEGWPSFIHDPLPPQPERPPKLRLRETIRCLNTHQKNRLLRFRGDGTGERVRWGLIETPIRLFPVAAREA